jgi:AcrR family transcriptional regulator
LTGHPVKFITPQPFVCQHRRIAGVVRPYRGVSAEERRAGRRAKLIEAGLDLLGTRGLPGTTMTAVCAHAGLTERYFYESFRDRDELLLAVFDACTLEMDEAMFRALDAAPPDLMERCRAAAGAMIGVLTDDPRKARLYTEAIGLDVLKERRSQGIAAHAALLAEQMRALRGLDSEWHDAPLRLASTVIMAGLAEAILSWLDGSLDMSREMLVEECARLAVAAADAVRDTTSAG